MTFLTRSLFVLATSRKRRKYTSDMKCIEPSTHKLTHDNAIMIEINNMLGSYIIAIKNLHTIEISPFVTRSSKNEVYLFLTFGTKTIKYSLLEVELCSFFPSPSATSTA